MNRSDLVEIEATRRLKARYFRFLDTKQQGAWREISTEDFRAEIQGPHPVIHCESRNALVESMREVLAQVPTVHHGHMPEIEPSQLFLSALLLSLLLVAAGATFPARRGRFGA